MLTIEQRLAVAMAVTGHEHRYGEHDSGRMCIYKANSLRAHLILWEPEDNVYQWQKLVEWLARQGDYPRHDGYDVVTDGMIEFESELVAAIRKGDVAKLESLAFELLDGCSQEQTRGNGDG